MRNRMMLAAVLLSVLTLFFACAKKDQGGESSTEDKELAARVGDWEFTVAELDEMIAQLPEQKRREMDTPGGRVEVTNRAIAQQLYYEEGLKTSLDKDSEVVKRLEEYARALVISEYFKREIEPLAAPSEEEMHEFYERNQTRFTTLPMVRGQHIFSANKEKLEDFKKRIDAGEPMTTLAHKYSEDELTRDDGGDLGYFNPGGYIRGIGYSKIISDAAFNMPIGVVSDPIKWEKGYSLLKVIEMRPESLKPFEEVRDEIRREFVGRNIEAVAKEVTKKLRDQYQITNYLEEQLNLTQRTAEELWNLAQTSSDPYHRLRNYEEIVERFPDSPHAPKALFMIGFVYAEELKSNVDAEKAFWRVMNEYPESDVAKSAAWMRENMNSPLPEFESIDDLNKKIQAESN